MNPKDLFHSESIRKLELDLIISELKTTDLLLEIGGGSGFQAAIISGHVAKCVSIDVRQHPEVQYPIHLYDGTTIPFKDSSFDIIFSSSVLEHVRDLDGLLAECARVLKPNGIMYHIVPSPIWRIWTSLTYYLSLPKVLLANFRNLALSDDSPPKWLGPNGKEQMAKGNNEQGAFIKPPPIVMIIRSFKLKWIRSILISPRHGERGNEITEAFYFRAHWWRRLFKKNGWRVANEQPSQLFYSGNILFGTLVGLQTRRKLSHFLGSSTRLFKVVRLID